MALQHQTTTTNRSFVKLALSLISHQSVTVATYQNCIKTLITLTQIPYLRHNSNKIID